MVKIDLHGLKHKELEDSSSDEEEQPTFVGFFVCGMIGRLSPNTPKC
tara:strand:- start:741 stop:881 length:141 start_codon:yes stop_codon:yes gene_type:complete